MNDTGTTHDHRAMRLRRLRFRAWHRGLREADLILGRFADAHIDRLSEEDLTEFEALLEVPDRQVVAWATGQEPVPAEHDTPLFRKILAARPGRGA